MNRLHLIALTSLTALLMGCEGNTNYTFVLSNQTANTLTLQHALGQYSSSPDTISLVIPPNAETTIGIVDHLGGRSETLDAISLQSEFSFVFELTTSSGDTLLKDWGVPENWAMAAEELNRIPANWAHTCTFSVAEGDF